MRVLVAKYENRPRGDEAQRLVVAGRPSGQLGRIGGRPRISTGMAIVPGRRRNRRLHSVAQTYNVDGGNWMSW